MTETNPAPDAASRRTTGDGSAQDVLHTTVLDNGVRVVVREICAAPVVALNLWVGTGGVDDPVGRAGLSHFIEHMLFKPDGPGGTDLARVVYGAGGYVNAMTGPDHTTYYQVVPSATWREVLAAQAAVIGGGGTHGGSRFQDTDVDTERAVIIEELRSGEGNPETLLWRRLMEAAYVEHPIRRPVVGDQASLKELTARDLEAHFDAHYRGGNAVVVVVGDVDADEVLTETARAFGSVPAGDRPPHWGGTEPEQASLRALSLHGPVVQPYLSLAFHVPEVLHPDTAALDVLAGLLGRGRSSQLRHRLELELGLVSDIGAGIAAYRDTGLFVIRASATTPDVAEVIGRSIEEARAFAVHPPDRSEMEKTLRRLEAAYLLEHETPEAIAGGLGYFELMGDCRLAETYIDRLAAVTPEDVARVAAEYLRPESATVAVYGPEALGLPEGDVSDLMAARVAGFSGFGTGSGGGSGRGAESTGEAAGGAVRECARGWKSAVFVRPTIIAERRRPVRSRERLPSGATLVTSSSDTLPLTSVAIAFPGGHCLEDDASLGSTYLAMRTAVRGSTTRSGFELAEEVEAMGTSFSTLVDRDGFGLGSTCLARLQAEAVSLLGEVVAEPAFAREQFDMAKSDVDGEIGETEDHPFRRAVLELLPLLFPAHPYGRPLRGTHGSVDALDARGVRERHLANLSAGRMLVCASGSVDAGALRDAVAKLAARLPGRVPGEHTSSTPALATPPTPGVVTADRTVEHGRPGQSHVALGVAGPAAGSEDGVALRFLTRVLSMMGGRLWVALRENPPHAYSASASTLLLATGGAVLFSVTAKPGDEEAAKEGIRAVLSDVRRDGLSPDEFERARSYVAGTMEIAMQRESTRAASYAMAEILGVGFERMEEMPAAIRGLTNDAVIRVAREWLDPDDGVASVVLRTSGAGA